MVSSVWTIFPLLTSHNLSIHPITCQEVVPIKENKKNTYLKFNRLGDLGHVAPCRDLGTVSSEQGSGYHILSGASHLCPGVVQNEQESSHLPQRVQMVRKLVEPTRIRLGSWNVGSFTGKLRELVDTAVMRRVNILCVQETKWKGQKTKEVDNTGFKLWYTGTTSNKNEK